MELNTESLRLRRCPFCGGGAKLCSSAVSPACDVVVECGDCRAGTAFYNDGSYEELREKAIAAWNRRYVDEP